MNFCELEIYGVKISKNSYSIHAYIAKKKGKNKDNLTVKVKLVRETTLGTNHGQASR